MTALEKTLSAIEAACPDARRARARVLWTRREIARLESELTAELVGHHSGACDHQNNNSSAVMAIARTTKADDLAKLRAMLALLEGTEHYKASADLEPLFAKLDENERRKLEGW